MYSCDYIHNNPTLSSIGQKYIALHPALWPIGKNIREFKKVYEYYSKPEDSLKLRAAVFLIENMDQHFFFEPKNEAETDKYFRDISIPISIDSFSNPDTYWWLRDELFNEAISKALSDGSLPKTNYRVRSDIKTIKAEFLIENIEYAFKAWNFPWARSYTFEDFCRYILPYRYGREAPGSWRKTICEKYNWIADSIQNPNDPMEAANIINEQFQYELSMADKLAKTGFKLKITNQLDANVYSNCQELAGLGVCVLRALGISATVVSIPAWGYKAWGHQLTGFLDSNNKWHYFDFGESGPEVDLKLGAPKMYLRQFDKMENFRPVLEDASARLMKVVDAEVELFNNVDDDIYLCVFGDLKWKPVCKERARNSKIIFKNLGQKKTMYLAAIKSGRKLKAASNTFTVDSLGKVNYFKPNESKTISAAMNRKYMQRRTSLIGGAFYLASSNNFENSELLYEIKDTLDYNDNIFKSIERKGKFFRYNFPQLSNSNLDGPAEVSFYTTINGILKKIEGKYYGSPQLSQKHINLMTDNDILTYVEVWDCQKDLEIETSKFILRKYKEPIWIGLEADSTVTVTHVGICPRNDKNGIYAGMHYELFYWNNKWKSLGVNVATTDSIRFDGIPENAVLWLRNLDEGKEERIFTLKDGEQVWW